jgi:hypothetical protein
MVYGSGPNSFTLLPSPRKQQEAQDIRGACCVPALLLLLLYGFEGIRQVLLDVYLVFGCDVYNLGTFTSTWSTTKDG